MPFKDEIISELKFVAMCQGTTKTVRHRKSSSLESKGDDNHADDDADDGKPDDAEKRRQSSAQTDAHDSKKSHSKELKA